MKRGLWVLAGILLLAWTNPCRAADAAYPTKPIHIWVGFAAGGTTDTLTRTVASIAEKTLGQPIIVENKPGGGGAVCLGLISSARPDGYTLGASSDSAFTRTPHMVRVVYDSMKDFAPLVRMGLTKQGIVVLAGSPFKKLQDIIDFARKNPGRLTYSTPGSGTSARLGMEKIALEEKVKFQHVPFQGDAPAITAVLGGHVMVCVTAAQGWMSHAKAGSIRPLLVFDSQGIEEWPEVPGYDKLGYSFEPAAAQLIFAPKGVPKPIMDKLIAAFSGAMTTSRYQKTAKQMELMVGEPLSQMDFQKWLQEQYDMYGTLIKQLGLKKAE